MTSFLAARSEAASDNEAWSRQELGKWVSVLDLGCALLDASAREVADHVNTRGDAESPVERAISLLSMWMVARAGSACALLLQGYPTDAGALMRALLEGEALQTHLAMEPDSADAWARNEEVRVREFLSAVTKEDDAFGRMWNELGAVVHPSRKAVINQVDEIGGGARLGGRGARRQEQLYKLTAIFGVQVERELQFLQRTFEQLHWSDGLRTLIARYDSMLVQMHGEVLSRWPNSKALG